MFTSDNGGERFSDTWPLVGKKMDLLEGGIRVPYIARWPGRIRAGTTTTQQAITMDWTATMLAAAGVAPHDPFPLDGISLLPVLAEPGAPIARDLYWRMKFRGQKALRSGDWKYLVLDGDEFLFDCREISASVPTSRAAIPTGSPTCAPATRRGRRRCRPFPPTPQSASRTPRPTSPCRPPRSLNRSSHFLSGENGLRWVKGSQGEVVPDKPLVSVIIPCHNDGQYLAIAINSVLSQQGDIPTFEIVVVNDHSTDPETARVLQKWERADSSRPRPRQPRQRGVSAARNHGIRAAHGEWIAFLDADDAWTPESLATRLKAFEQAPGAFCVSSDYVHVYDDGRCEERGTIEATRRDDEGWGPLLRPAFATNAAVRIPDGLDLMLSNRTIILTSSVIAHRSLFGKAGEFDERLRAARTRISGFDSPCIPTGCLCRRPWCGTRSGAEA